MIAVYLFCPNSHYPFLSPLPPSPPVFFFIYSCLSLPTLDLPSSPPCMISPPSTLAWIFDTETPAISVHESRCRSCLICVYRTVSFCHDHLAKLVPCRFIHTGCRIEIQSIEPGINITCAGASPRRCSGLKRYSAIASHGRRSAAHLHIRDS